MIAVTLWQSCNVFRWFWNKWIVIYLPSCQGYLFTHLFNWHLLHDQEVSSHWTIQVHPNLVCMRQFAQLFSLLWQLFSAATPLSAITYVCQQAYIPMKIIYLKLLSWDLQPRYLRCLPINLAYLGSVPHGTKSSQCIKFLAMQGCAWQRSL